MTRDLKRMNRSNYLCVLYGIFFLFAALPSATAQDNDSLNQVATNTQRKLEASLAKLNEMRELASQEMIPLSRKLSDLENELIQARQEYQQVTRQLDRHTLDVSNLRSEIQSRQAESTYLSNLLGEYIRNFESRLHIAEFRRYEKALEEAKLARDNSNLSEDEVFSAQSKLLEIALGRLFESFGGDRFNGSAVDANGVAHTGVFVLLGPTAIFRSHDGQIIGTAIQRLGSLEPTIIPFNNPRDTEAAARLITDSLGYYPLDPTLGSAHKIEETRETLWEHIQKGGPVMYPIFGLAAAALFVALYKWICLLFVRTPSDKKIRALLTAVAERDEENVKRTVKKIRGPIGNMLAAGVAHLREPRELIEEIMYERILTTRLKLERFIPFIAVCASAAPLLGLLGTVTGIINTFKLITVFGSGDVKTLSSGISEALVTTEFGLIIAIPALLIHAFLSRKARGIVNQMEKAAVALINQISKTPFEPTVVKPLEQ